MCNYYPSSSSSERPQPQTRAPEPPLVGSIRAQPRHRSVAGRRGRPRPCSDDGVGHLAEWWYHKSNGGVKMRIHTGEQCGLWPHWRDGAGMWLFR